MSRSPRNAILIAAALGGIHFTQPGTAGAFSSGPLDGLTNAPGEGNCTGCHTSFPLNSGTGTLEVLGLPAQYTPGSDYLVEIRLADPAAARWGFEFTIIDAQGDSQGSLAPVDGNTQVSTGGAFGRTYAKHTSAGTNTGQTGQNSWTVSWTAPPAGAGGLGLFVAGNAANGNGTNSGDRIYATDFIMGEEDLSTAPLPGPVAELRPCFPNPFNPRTVVSFELAEETGVSLTVFDVRGLLVRTLHRGDLPAGVHRFVWQGDDAAGRPQPLGLYIARLAGLDGRDLSAPVKMTLAR